MSKSKRRDDSTNMKTRQDGSELLSCNGLTRAEIRRLAFETGFCQRASGKIDAPDFLIHLCVQSIQGTVSHNDLAERIHLHTGVSASRQVARQYGNQTTPSTFQDILRCEKRPHSGLQCTHSGNL